MLNYGLIPGVKIDFEDFEEVPPEPVIFAMNHTDRYNYFPFQYTLWRIANRFTATWVKGKYYESRFVGGFMESMNQLPTVSRGYIITLSNGSFTLTGQTAGLVAALVLTAVNGSFTLAGQAVGLAYSAVSTPDERIYVIDAENRTYIIDAENRTYIIDAENRTYIIPEP